MSEPAWSERKQWNNDGMDPDWRPAPTPPRVTVGTKLDDLLGALEPLIEVLRREGSVPLDTPDSIRVTMRGARWKTIDEAYEALK